MIKDKKLQDIKDMGIDINEDCPRDYGFFDRKICIVTNCGDCWIDTLESGGVTHAN